MKKNELNILRKKEIKDLGALVGKKKKEAQETNVQMKASRQSNVKKYKNVSRDIAQILTIIREKEIIGEAQKEENK